MACVEGSHLLDKYKWFQVPEIGQITDAPFKVVTDVTFQPIVTLLICKVIPNNSRIATKFKLMLKRLMLRKFCNGILNITPIFNITLLQYFRRAVD